jgi:alkylation response protein AidB-like acyl-CoA dehydrogenase
MDLQYPPVEEAFRARVRGWLEKNVPQQKGPLSLQEGKAWQRKLKEGGFLGAAWPKEYGGAGLSDMEQAILNEELTRAKAPAIPGGSGPRS